MSDRGEHQLPDDLMHVAERLRDERPALDRLDFDLIQTRARARATAAERAASRNRKGAFLKSRIAITMILALGILMSLSGATLAVSGLGESGGDASDVQYFNEPGESGEPDDSSSSSSEDVLGDSSGSDDTVEVQEAAQESSGGDDEELAFTGFAAIPVLIGGIALLGSGFVLRRRSER